MDKNQSGAHQAVSESERIGLVQQLLSFGLRHYLLLLFMFIQIPIVIYFIVDFSPNEYSWLSIVLTIIVSEIALAVGLLFCRRHFGRYGIDGIGILIDPTFPEIDTETDKDQD